MVLNPKTAYCLAWLFTKTKTSRFTGRLLRTFCSVVVWFCLDVGYLTFGFLSELDLVFYVDIGFLFDNVKVVRLPL